jgi:uncharacterized membrane protein
MIWTTAAPAIVTAFVSSLVEAVEALTIVLAVATVRGWRPAGLGAIAGLALLAAIVLALGPLLNAIPLQALQLLIGVLLLLFGMRWLRKAILRAAGVIALHDETRAFAHETSELREQALRLEERLDWLAGITSFKAVVLEGLEVVFIVIAVGAAHGLLVPASIGAIAACLLVTAVGFFVHRGACTGKHAQVRGRCHAVRIRIVLDRGRHWRRLAGRRPCDSGVCSVVSNRRTFGIGARAAPQRGGPAMRVLTGILRELAGLFVDDGWLAIAILGVVALAAVVAALTPAGSLAAGVVLVCGLLAVLLINVRAAATR